MANEDPRAILKQVSVDAAGALLERKSYIKPGLLIFMYALSFSVAIPAFPLLTLKLCDGDSAQSAYYYGVGMTIRYVTETIFQPFLGTLSDVAGRRVVLLLSYLTCGAEFFFMGVAPSINMLFICRMLTGLGDTGITSAYTIFSDIGIYNKDNLSITYGRVQATIIVAFVVGPVAGGLICDKFGAKVCLLIGATLCWAAAVIAYFLLDETLEYNGVDISDKMVYLITGKRKTPAPARSRAASCSVNSSIRESDRDRTYEGLHCTMGGGGGGGDSGNFSMKGTAESLIRVASTKSDSTIADGEVCRAIYNSGEDDLIGKAGDKGTDNNAANNAKIPLICCCFDMSYLRRFTIIANPLPDIRIHLKNKKIRQLLVPIFLSNLTTGGLISIWYIFMDYMFQASAIEVGYYLSAMALTTTFVMGFLLNRIVPHILSEKKTIVLGYLLAACQFAVIGTAKKYGYLFISLIFIIGTMADPAVTGILVKQSMLGVTKMTSTSRLGNLQGLLSSVKTIGSAIGSILFSNLFSYGVGLSPAKPWIPFMLAFCLLVTASIYMGLTFQREEWKRVTTGSRLSKDAPDDRPIYEDDFIRQSEGVQEDERLAAIAQFTPLINDADRDV
jgi:MFS family permease